MNKQELVVALCCYLPYDLKVNYTTHKSIDELKTVKNAALTPSLLDRFVNLQESWYDNIVNIIPKLRPLSSMTEDERKEYLQQCDLDNNDTLSTPHHHGIDWLNAHHFDYRFLIEQGAAVEDIRPSELIKNDIYKIANIVFELSKINSGGNMEPNFSMQQIFDCYDAFDESDAKGREYYRQLENYVKENNGPECKGLMYSPKI